MKTDNESVTVDANVNSPMHELLKRVATPPKVGDVIEGPVISIGKAAVYIDLKSFGTGIIYGREYLQARDVLKKIAMGDTVSAQVVDAHNEDGYVELSLHEARQALIWTEAEDAIKKKLTVELPIKDANKGGLILEWQGIAGFLPASQLKPEHYPRVEDGSKERILEELKKLIGEKITVTIIGADQKEGKLIFSEKDSGQKEKREMVEKYAVGDERDGTVTGIVDFGVFVKIEEGLEGLVHISEMDWALVENPRTLYKVGDKVRVKVIDVKDGKVSLSIKALKDNPWTEASKKYTKGDTVTGVVIKFNQYGALVSIEEGVAGLVHFSEFGTMDKLRAALELGKTYSFKITLFEAKDQKMTLSFAQANAAGEETK